MPAFFVSASSTLNLSDLPQDDTVFTRETGSVWTLLVDYASTNFHLRSVTSSLALSDTISNQFIVENVADVLNLSDTGSEDNTTQSVSHNLIFTQNAASSIQGPIAPQTVGLSDSVSVQAPNQLDMGHNLSVPTQGDFDPDTLPAPGDPDFADKMAALVLAKTLRDEVSYRFAVKTVAVTHNLSFAENAAPFTSLLTVGSQLHLSDAAESVLAESLTDVLSLQQSVSLDRTSGVADSLVLLSAATVNIVASRAITTTAVFADVAITEATSVIPQVPTGPNQVIDPRQEYNPDGSLPVVFPLPVVPETRGLVKFSYPAPLVSEDTILEIRPPDLQNQETMNFRRVLRRTRGGKMQSFRRPIWPKWTRLRMTYPVLTETERFNMFAFFKLTLGQTINFVDWEGRTWEGVITTPQAAFEQIGKGCQHEITLEFQGELI